MNNILRKLQIYASDIAKLWNIDNANTARTTSTVVGAVQNIDATGKVSPAGDTLANAPFSKDTIYNSSGTEIFTTTNRGQVDVYSPLPVGTNNIGDVDIVTMPNVTLNALPSGTNNIGDVDVLTMPVVHTIVDSGTITAVTAITNALPAGTNNIGDVDVVTMPVVHIIADSGTISTITNVVHIDDNGGSVTVDGTVAISNSSIPVTDNGGSITIDDGGSSITVDGTVTTTLPTDVANTARTTSTLVLPIQLVDATGKVQPAGEVYTNPIFTANRLIDEAGTAYGVKHIQNKIRTSSVPYLYDIAEGNISGHTPFYKIGYNSDVGTTEEEIITQGGLYYWIPTATALEVVSSSANDTLAGTGIQKVRVTYLDADYSEASEVLNMNGTTPVPLTDTTIIRVNSIRATQVGTGLMSAGTINVRTVVGGNIVRSIATGFTRGRGLVHTVPLGKTLYLTSITIASGYTTSGKVVRWFARAQVDDTDPTTKINFFMPFFENITQDNNIHVDFDMPIRIPATADLKVSALSDGAGSYCSCSIRGWIE